MNEDIDRDLWKRVVANVDLGDGAARRARRVGVRRAAIELAEGVGLLDPCFGAEHLGFLSDPAIPWHDNHTESDIRALARYRAVTGGTRSESGGQNVAHWMSVTQTRRKNGLPLRSFVVGVYDAHVHGTSPPSVFAP